MWRKVVALLGLTLFLGACGDASDHKDGESTGGTTDTGVASLELLVSSSQLPSDGSDPVTLTALAKDSSNTVVEGEKISFSSDSGALQVTQGTTEASGQALAELTPGGNAANRVITVTASSGSAQASEKVEVSGTTLSLNGPTSLVYGESADWTVSLKDASGNGIGGETVQVSSQIGNTLATGTGLTTDTTGKVQFSLTADTNTGTDTLSADSMGLTATDEVEITGEKFQFAAPASGKEVDIGANQEMAIHWEDKGGNPRDSKIVEFSTTRGSFPNGSGATTDSNGDASVPIISSDSGTATVTATGPNGTPSAQRTIEFVATTADTLSLQADPTILAPQESSDITAVVRDPNGNPVKNKTVDFTLTDSGGAGGQLSSGLVTTDSQGRATTSYQASSNTSSQNGVEIKAVVQGRTSVQDKTTLTVAQEAINVKIGTGGKLKELSDQKYAKRFVVLVTDSNGSAIKGEKVEFGLKAEKFYKGVWKVVDDSWGQFYDTTNDGIGDTVGAFPCPNEDTDLDDQREPGEDVDRDETLEPGHPAGLSAETVATDENGFAEVDVVYPQSEGGWSQVTLGAAVNTNGSEGRAETTFDLGVLASEVQDTDTSMPGGSKGPYGIRDDCTDPL